MKHRERGALPRPSPRTGPRSVPRTGPRTGPRTRPAVSRPGTVWGLPVVAVVFLWLQMLTGSHATCPQGTEHDGKCYVIQAGTRSWTDARALCAQMSGTLPVVTDDVTQGVITRLMRETETASIWLDAQVKKMDWHWASSGAVVGHQGCYNDAPWDPDLEMVTSIPEMNPDLCVAACRQRGYLYAAVQSKVDCYCGATYGKYGLTDTSGTWCSVTCPGSDQYCGGWGKNSVYNINGGYASWSYKQPDTSNHACAVLDTPGNDRKFAAESCFRKHPYICSIPMSDCRPAEEGFHTSGGVCLYIGDALTWWQAYNACAQKAGHLLVVQNATHHDVIRRILNVTRFDGRQWIGLTRSNWVWADTGTIFSWTAWADSSPSGLQGRCLSISNSSGDMWEDRACTEQLTTICSVVAPSTADLFTAPTPTTLNLSQTTPNVSVPNAESSTLSNPAILNSTETGESNTTHIPLDPTSGESNTAHTPLDPTPEQTTVSHHHITKQISDEPSTESSSVSSMQTAAVSSTDKLIFTASSEMGSSTMSSSSILPSTDSSFTRDVSTPSEPDFTVTSVMNNGTENNSETSDESVITVSQLPQTGTDSETNTQTVVAPTTDDTVSSTVASTEGTRDPVPVLTTQTDAATSNYSFPTTSSMVNETAEAFVPTTGQSQLSTSQLTETTATVLPTTEQRESSTSQSTETTESPVVETAAENLSSTSMIESSIAPSSSGGITGQHEVSTTASAVSTASEVLTTAPARPLSTGRELGTVSGVTLNEGSTSSSPEPPSMTPARDENQTETTTLPAVLLDSNITTQQSDTSDVTSGATATSYVTREMTTLLMHNTTSISKTMPADSESAATTEISLETTTIIQQPTTDSTDIPGTAGITEILAGSTESAMSSAASVAPPAVTKSHILSTLTSGRQHYPALSTKSPADEATVNLTSQSNDNITLSPGLPDEPDEESDWSKFEIVVVIGLIALAVGLATSMVVFLSCKKKSRRCRGKSNKTDSVQSTTETFPVGAPPSAHITSGNGSIQNGGSLALGANGLSAKERRRSEQYSLEVTSESKDLTTMEGITVNLVDTKKGKKQKNKRNGSIANDAPGYRGRGGPGPPSTWSTIPRYYYGMSDYNGAYSSGCYDNNEMPDPELMQQAVPLRQEVYFRMSQVFADPQQGMVHPDSKTPGPGLGVPLTTNPASPICVLDANGLYEASPYYDAFDPGQNTYSSTFPRYANRNVSNTAVSNCVETPEAPSVEKNRLYEQSEHSRHQGPPNYYKKGARPPTRTKIPPVNGGGVGENASVSHVSQADGTSLPPSSPNSDRGSVTHGERLSIRGLNHKPRTTDVIVPVPPRLPGAPPTKRSPPAPPPRSSSRNTGTEAYPEPSLGVTQNGHTTDRLPEVNADAKGRKFYRMNAEEGITWC